MFGHGREREVVLGGEVIGAAGVLGTLITQGLTHRALSKRRVGGSEAMAEPGHGQPT